MARIAVPERRLGIRDFRGRFVPAYGRRRSTSGEPALWGPCLGFAGEFPGAPASRDGPRVGSCWASHRAESAGNRAAVAHGNAARPCLRPQGKSEVSSTREAWIPHRTPRIGVTAEQDLRRVQDEGGGTRLLHVAQIHADLDGCRSEAGLVSPVRIGLLDQFAEDRRRSLRGDESDTAALADFVVPKRTSGRLRASLRACYAAEL